MKVSHKAGTHKGASVRRGAKWLAAAAATAPIVAMPALGAVPSALAAEFDYFPPDSARVLTLSFLPGGNNDDLRGVVCQAPRACESVPYPYLIRSVGVTDLDTKLRDGTTGQQVVFGYSQGARVASDWLETYAGTEGALSPDDVSFVLIGNPSRKHGGAHVGWGQVTPDTGYKVLDVARQYDMASDFPDEPLNLLALANAYAGFAFVHEDYEEVDLYDPANYVWKEGNTTYVFVPTENIPLLQPLRWLGLSGLADALNGPLKAMIEKAYDRSYLPAQPGWPAPEPEPEPEEPPVDPAPEPPATLTFDTTTVSHTAERQTANTEAQSELDSDEAAGDPGADDVDSEDLDTGNDAGSDEDTDSDDESVEGDSVEDDTSADAEESASESQASEDDPSDNDSGADNEGGDSSGNDE
jgi:hypothetical protein